MMSAMTEKVPGKIRDLQGACMPALAWERRAVRGVRRRFVVPALGVLVGQHSDRSAKHTTSGRLRASSRTALGAPTAPLGIVMRAPTRRWASGQALGSAVHTGPLFVSVFVAMLFDEFFLVLLAEKTMERDDADPLDCGYSNKP